MPALPHPLGDPLVFEVLGVPIAYVPTDELISRIVAAAAAREGLSVFIPNANTLNLATDDPSYRAVLQRGDIVVNDGIGVRIAARLAGLSELENQNGTDLTPAVCAAGADVGLRVFWLGGVDGRAAAAGEALQREFPGLEIAGTHHGYFDDGDDIARRIAGTRPHLVLVSLGNPLQEIWIDRHLSQLDGAVAMGVGALVDRYAGLVERPPEWVQRSGLEWAHRLVNDPAGLWRRYLLGNPRFVARILQDRPRVLHS